MPTQDEDLNLQAEVDGLELKKDNSSQKKRDASPPDELSYDSSPFYRNNADGNPSNNDCFLEREYDPEPNTKQKLILSTHKKKDKPKNREPSLEM